jgi:hypothetical protein
MAKNFLSASTTSDQEIQRQNARDVVFAASLSAIDLMDVPPSLLYPVVEPQQKHKQFSQGKLFTPTRGLYLFLRG